MSIFFPILEKKKKKEEEVDKRIPLHIYNTPQEPSGSVDNPEDKKKKKSNNDLYIDVNKEFDVDFTLDIFWDYYEHSGEVKYSGELS